MKTVIYSREGRDYSRGVTEFVEVFQRKYPGRSIDILDPDTREAISMAGMHGITRYPAVVVSAADGRVLQIWQGEHLPLLDEVAAYVLG